MKKLLFICLLIFATQGFGATVKVSPSSTSEKAPAQPAPKELRTTGFMRADKSFHGASFLIHLAKFYGVSIKTEVTSFDNLDDVDFEIWGDEVSMGWFLSNNTAIQNKTHIYLVWTPTK